MFNESGKVVVSLGSVCPGCTVMAPVPLPGGWYVDALGCLRFSEPGAQLLWLEGAPWSVGEMGPLPGGKYASLAVSGTTALGPVRGDNELGTTTRGSVLKIGCKCGAPF